MQSIAQSPEQYFDKITALYADKSSISYDATIDLYTSATSKDKKDSGKIKMIKCDGNMYYAVAEQEAISTKKYQLLINHNDKMIIVSSVKEKSQPEFSFKLDSLLLMIGIDSSNIEKNRISKIDKKDTYKWLKIELAYSSFEKIEIAYNQEYMIQKLILFQKKEELFSNGEYLKPRFEIAFFNMEFNCNSAAYFNIKKYITADENGGYKANASYPNYTVYNNL